MSDDFSQDDNGKHRLDSLFRTTGSPEQMRVQEERLLMEG